MAAHLFWYRKATYEVRAAAWNSSKSLRENKLHPMGCPLVTGSPSCPSNMGSFTPSLLLPESTPLSESTAKRTTMAQTRVTSRDARLNLCCSLGGYVGCSLITFLHHRWPLSTMAGFCFCEKNHISFRAIVSTSFVEAVRRIRLACVTTVRLPSRWNLGG
jgi:hypothetical protein